MNASHRRRGPFVGAIVLLAAATYFVLWTGGDPSVPDEGEGAAAIIHRMLKETKLSRMLKETQLKMYQNPAMMRNRQKLISEGACNGVLITSQGGVGSSEFIKEIERVELGGASFYTNDHQDADGLKHLPATRWEHTAEGVRHEKVHWNPGEDCYSKALVIIGDPVHTIESTYRRFRLSHLNKLRKGSGQGKFNWHTTLGDIYDDTARGLDPTGIAHYVSSWYEASQDREHWPDVRLVTAKTLFNHAAPYARWIGVDEGSLPAFERLYFDESRQHATEPSVDDEGVREKVAEAFGKVGEIIDLVNNAPPPMVAES